VDTEFFKFGCVDEGRSEHFTFGMTGAWIERKGWKVLAEAWGKADTGDAVLRLRPTFSDAPTQSLKDAVKLFEGLDNVEFAAVDNTKERGGIREFYASIDVNLYPSYGDTIPKAILEPGALGTPSIGSDSSGIAELLVANLQSASQVFAASTEPVEIPAIDSLSGIRQVWEKASWYPPSAEALALRIESAIDQGRTYWEGIGIENMNIIENTYSSAIATKQIRAAWKEIF
jgi:glycosyltransferase involved in cell wall biosynthesis